MVRQPLPPFLAVSQPPLEAVERALLIQREWDWGALEGGLVDRPRDLDMVVGDLDGDEGLRVVDDAL